MAMKPVTGVCVAIGRICARPAPPRQEANDRMQMLRRAIVLDLSVAMGTHT
jgi:hypothetical protein